MKKWAFGRAGAGAGAGAGEVSRERSRGSCADSPRPPVPPVQPVPPSPGHPLGRPPAHSPDSHSHPSPNPSHFTLPYLPVSREKYDLITTRRDTLITKLQLEKAEQQGPCKYNYIIK